MAVDLVWRRAAGAAIGLVGLFSYLVAGVQDTLSGYLLDVSKVVAKCLWSASRASHEVSSPKAGWVIGSKTLKSPFPFPGSS
jgi:sugar phosphate permease